MVEIQKIAMGVRGITKPRGRPQKNGERYPSGDLKPDKVKPAIEPIAPALWDRLRKDAVKAVEDSRLGSELGRLSLQGELSATQTAAGFRLAEIYGRFERYKNMRRSAGSPSYMVASSWGSGDGAVEAITPEMLARSMAEDLLEPTELAELEQKIRAAEKRFHKLQNVMRVLPPNVREALEQLCVEDRRINPAMLDNARLALDELAVFFRVKAAPKDPTKKRRETVVHKDGSQTEIQDPDKTAWLTVLAKLRPDLSEPERIRVYAMAVALKARAVVDRHRGKRPVVSHQGFSQADLAARTAAMIIAAKYPKIEARLEDADPVTSS